MVSDARPIPEEVKSGSEGIDFKKAYLLSLSKEELADKILNMDKGKIDKRLAAVEVKRWAGKLRFTALAGIVLSMLQFAATMYSETGEAFAFILLAGGASFFAWMLGDAVKYIKYLRDKYGV